MLQNQGFITEHEWRPISMFTQLCVYSVQSLVLQFGTLQTILVSSELFSCCVPVNKSVEVSIPTGLLRYLHTIDIHIIIYTFFIHIILNPTKLYTISLIFSNQNYDLVDTVNPWQPLLLAMYVFVKCINKYIIL